jgi:hypothetical protein
LERFLSLWKFPPFPVSDETEQQTVRIRAYV